MFFFKNLKFLFSKELPDYSATQPHELKACQYCGSKEGGITQTDHFVVCRPCVKKALDHALVKPQVIKANHVDILI